MNGTTACFFPRPQMKKLDTILWKYYEHKNNRKKCFESRQLVYGTLVKDIYKWKN